MAEVAVLHTCRGLNTRDHPLELHTDNGVYLSKAVNVDITDRHSLTRRNGFSVLTGGLTKAHSLASFLDNYLIYADGGGLFCYELSSGTTTTISDDLTADKPICFTEIGEQLAYTNGVERGVIVMGGSAPEVAEYFPFVSDPSQADREIVEFPMTDIFTFYNGSVYGGVLGREFIYCSEPYKPNHYDQIKGHISLAGKLQWLAHVGSGIVVGTSAGIQTFPGHGLADFTERTVSLTPTKACSDYTEIRLSNEGGAKKIKGILILNNDGISYLTDQMELIELTSKLDLNWEKVSGGSFGQIKNSYIFSGVL